MPPRPSAIEEWLDLGRRIIQTASSESEIRRIKVLADLLRAEARVALCCRARPPTYPRAVERNIKPREAAQRLGISLRKLTRGRFTTYREICIPIEGQSRGYVVSETALGALMLRQRRER